MFINSDFEILSNKRREFYVESKEWAKYDMPKLVWVLGSDNILFFFMYKFDRMFTKQCSYLRVVPLLHSDFSIFHNHRVKILDWEPHFRGIIHFESCYYVTSLDSIVVLMLYTLYVCLLISPIDETFNKCQF